MMEPSPASSFEMIEPDLLLQLLIVRSIRQRIMVISIMRSNAVSSGSIDDQNFVGSFSPFGHDGSG